MDEHKIVMGAITAIGVLGCLSSISPTVNSIITGILITGLVIGLLAAIGYLAYINCQHPDDKNITIPGHQAWWGTHGDPELRQHGTHHTPVDGCAYCPDISEYRELIQR